MQLFVGPVGKLATSDTRVLILSPPPAYYGTARFHIVTPKRSEHHTFEYVKAAKAVYEEHEEDGKVAFIDTYTLIKDHASKRDIHNWQEVMVDHGYLIDHVHLGPTAYGLVADSKRLRTRTFSTLTKLQQRYWRLPKSSART